MLKLTKSMATITSRRFSTSKDPVFQEMLSTAEQIKDYNFRSYFVRRLKEDWETAPANLDLATVEQLKERKMQLERIKVVQNLYYDEEKRQNIL
jgi:hypothetical protein